MAGIETAVEAALRYIIKRPRLTRSLDKANSRVLTLIAPAGFGKTTLAREWVAERPHVWYRGTTATADVAALAAGLSALVSEVIPGAGTRMVHRMRATGTPEQDVDILAELFAEDLAEWPDDLWLVIDDYQFAMEATAPERFVDVVLRTSPMRLLLASRARPTWATSRRLMYGEIFELGQNELAMDHDEAAAVLSHRKGAPAPGLVALAGGWPAVIGLAALAEGFELPEGSLPDSLHDYFAEELYQAASPGVQQGLCRLALAPSLSEGVAEFLLPDTANEVVGEGIRLGFLTGRPGSALELHPLLRTFLEAKNRERAEENDAAAKKLARHLAGLGHWDDAFSVVERFFSEALFVELLERGLPGMLPAARLPTLERWLELARSRQVDAAVIDLAEAEIAFFHGHRRKSEALALRATRRLDESDPFRSRAFYVAGMSAHMDHANERAGSHYDQALATAASVLRQRDAVWGQLMVSLDLQGSDSGELLERLGELDDGSAMSEVRLTVARFLVAIRTGTLGGLMEMFTAGGHLLPRVSEPHIQSSFHSSEALLLALLGSYSEALSAALRCEEHAREARLLFVIPHARRTRAIAELGLRHFSRCRQSVDWLEREADRRDDLFLGIESKLIRCRLLLSQGLTEPAAEIISHQPRRFPFEGERGEYLATAALALACADQNDLALDLAHEAESISQTVEVQVLAPCVRAVVALNQRQGDSTNAVREAFSSVLRVGNVDSFVVAYRAYPPLLKVLSQRTEFQGPLAEIVARARDWRIARLTDLPIESRKRARGQPLSEREEEVLGLVAQGLTNRAIANSLFISESTAKVHVRHILEKLGVRSRTEAALFVVGPGYQSQDDA
jgi:DNA-binding CsgD family transcriptional regulator